LELLDLRLELSEVFGQSLNLAPLHGRVWLTVERESPEGIFKDPEEGMRPSQVGLVDLPVHGIG
jgi:hypothetical protein